MGRREGSDDCDGGCAKRRNSFGGMGSCVCSDGGACGDGGYGDGGSKCPKRKRSDVRSGIRVMR